MYTPSATRYDTMKYRRCGKSGIQLPVISLGLWHNFGEVDNQEICRSIIHRSFDLGITHFDLANNYGPPPGSAETNFGNILKKDLSAYRDEMIISTKAGYYMWEGPYGEWGSKKYLVSSLDQSLKRLGIDYVDIFYSHRYDPRTPLEETMEALYLSVIQGKALYVGISNYSPEETKLASGILKTMGIKYLIHQPKYSMFYRWADDTKLFDVLETEGIGAIAFSPLAQGLLTNKYISGIPVGSRVSKPHGFLKEKDITEEKIRKVIELNVIAGERGQSLAQMALAWTLRDSRVTSALIGVSSVTQLEDNCATIQNLEFTEQELLRIEEVLKD